MFSDRGEQPTAVEAQLLAVTQAESAWVLVGRRIGAAALAVVLDELGGSAVSVPTRRRFFRGLYRPIRDERILLLRADGRSVHEIADAVGLCQRRVAAILAEDCTRLAAGAGQSVVEGRR